MIFLPVGAQIIILGVVVAAAAMAAAEFLPFRFTFGAVLLALSLIFLGTITLLT